MLHLATVRVKLPPNFVIQELFEWSQFNCYWLMKLSSAHICQPLPTQDTSQLPYALRAYSTLLSHSSPPECICPKLIDNVHRVRIVLQSFAHFVPVCCLDQSIDNEVLERRLVKESSGHNQESVEPARGRGGGGGGGGGGEGERGRGGGGEGEGEGHRGGIGTGLSYAFVRAHISVYTGVHVCIHV